MFIDSNNFEEWMKPSVPRTSYRLNNDSSMLRER
jgi:hypothetical protein